MADIIKQNNISLHKKFLSSMVGQQGKNQKKFPQFLPIVSYVGASLTSQAPTYFPDKV